MEKFFSFKPVRPRDCFWSSVAGKIWIFNSKTIELHVLEDKMTADVWRLCNGKSTVMGIVRRLEKKSAKSMNIGKKVTNILNDLESRQIISWKEVPYETARVKRFAGPQLNRLVKELKSREGVLAIFLRGSTARGFATSLSDIDVGLITTTVNDNKTHREERKLKQSMVHIECYSKDEIENAVKNADTKDHSYALGLIQNAKKLFERDGYLSSLKRDIMNLNSNLQKNIAKKHLLKAWSGILDAFSEFQRGDCKNAVLSARLTIFDALCSLLISKGNYDLKEKWLYPNLKKQTHKYKRYVDLFEEIHGLIDVSRTKALHTIFLSAALVQSIEDFIEIRKIADN